MHALRPQEPLNLFLGSLSEESRQRLVSLSTSLSLAHGTVLHEPEEPPTYAYFLEDGIASLVVPFDNGTSAEVGLTGREGVVGALHLLGTEVNPTYAGVQIPGAGLRIRFSELRKVFAEAEDVRSRMLELLQYQHAISMQVSACNLLHDAEPRLARWMLMLADRTGSSTLPLTQEFIAQMVGARRTTVTTIAGSMQRAGLIEYRRGNVRLLNRPGLEQACCPCYDFTRRALAALFR